MSNYKKVTLLLISILIAVGFIYAYKLYDLNKQISSVESEIKKEEELLALIDRQFAEAEEDLAKDEAAGLYKQLPSSEGIPQLLNFLQQASDKNNILITNLTFTAETETEAKNDAEDERENVQQTIQFKLTAESNSYEALRLFIQDIYDYDRIINIEQFNLLEQNDTIVVELALELYYAPAMQRYIPELEPIKTYSPAGKINPTK